MSASRLATALVGAVAYVGTVALVLAVGRVLGARPGLGWLFAAYLLGVVVALLAVGAMRRRPLP